MTALIDMGGASNTPLIDRAILDELAAEGGAELLAEIAASLAEELGSALSALAATAEAGDAGEAARLFHFVKGSAATCGLAALGATAGAMERGAKAGMPPSPGDVEGLMRLWDDSRMALQDVIASV